MIAAEEVHMLCRDMKDIYLSEVIVRNVKSDLERYEPSLENERWVKRRMRAHFEAYMHANREMGAAGADMIWSLICTEVLLRSCKDIVAFRSQPLKPGVPLDQATVENNLKILANLKITWCEFFKPIGVEAWEQLKMLESNSSLEKCLKRQILEREEELVQFYCSEVSAERAEEWFAGMPQLVLFFVQSSGSACEPQLKKRK